MRSNFGRMRLSLQCEMTIGTNAPAAPLPLTLEESPVSSSVSVGDAEEAPPVRAATAAAVGEDEAEAASSPALALAKHALRSASVVHFTAKSTGAMPTNTGRLKGNASALALGSTVTVNVGAAPALRPHSACASSAFAIAKLLNRRESIEHALEERNSTGAPATTTRWPGRRLSGGAAE